MLLFLSQGVLSSKKKKKRSGVPMQQQVSILSFISSRKTILFYFYYYYYFFFYGKLGRVSVQLEIELQQSKETGRKQQEKLQQVIPKNLLNGGG